MSLRTSIQRQRMTKVSLSPLPSGYTECEYLESAGKQWIDTRIPVNDNNIVQIDFDWQEGTSLFGSSETGWSTNTAVWRESNSWLNILKTNGLVLIPFQAGRNVLYVSNDIVLYNGIRYLWGGDSNGAIGNVVCFKAFEFTSERFGKFKCYSFKIVDKFKGVPALDTNGRPCMFDVVSKTPFYNQGTGEFGYMTKNGVYVAPV